MLLLFAAASSLTASVAAASDATPDQIYAMAESGRLDQARAMVAQVLKDHPDSAKAHYVAAEVDAKSGLKAEARLQFQTAERLDPGLPFAKAGSAAELRTELFPAEAPIPVTSTSGQPATFAVVPDKHSHLPWLTIFGVILMVGVVILLVRRRPSTAPIDPPTLGNGVPPVGSMAAGYSPVPVSYPQGGAPPSSGSPIIGGLASGLEVGAGVVAGEELAHSLLDSGDARAVKRSDPEPHQDSNTSQNADMGGEGFGLKDTNSWGNGSGSDDSGGGGDDNW